MSVPVSHSASVPHSSSPLPAVFVERLRVLYPTQAEHILQSFTSRPPTSFRTNLLKISAAELKEQLQTAGFELEQVSWLPTAFILKNKTQRDLTEHPLYVQGYLYVQNLSSMLPPLVLDPQPNELILDSAAAPGSKTTQMAVMMNNTGQILANDTSLVRLFKLKANLELQGVVNVRTKRGLGELIWRQYQNYFDRSLVDVPCSMEGRFYTAQPKSYDNWSLKKMKELSKRQRALLRSAVSATKPGGVIVYSTCTLAPEENEVVVQWVLDKAAGTVELEPIEVAQVPWQNGVLEWQGQQFAPEIALTKRVIPSATMEGFFMAKLRKKA